MDSWWVSNHNHALFATALTLRKNIHDTKKNCTYQKEYLILHCVRVGCMKRINYILNSYKETVLNCSY